MNVVLRLLALITKVLNALLTPFFSGKPEGEVRRLPAIVEPLLKVSATDLAERIRNRQVSSEQICTIYINRIKEVNPLLNAVVEDRFENAIADARSVDLFLQTSTSSCEELRKSKPLLGVPVTIKESCSLAGLSLTVGTLGRRSIKAHSDGEAVERLKTSGAIPLLVSNTPEICLSWECTNFITGTTNNPYDLTRTSGGSSGGEGSLLGAGASLVGIGSDVAGSVRLPAMFNGVFGHKPTPKVIPIKGHYPYCYDLLYANFLVIGPMTRYAKDLRLMTKVMMNETANLRLDDKVNLAELKIFHMEAEDPNSVVLQQVQPEIQAAILQSVDYLRTKSKAAVSEFKFRELKNSLEIGGSELFRIQDIPDMLKGENHNLAVEFLKSALGLSKYTFNLLMFYLAQYVYRKFVMNDGYHRKNENLRELFIEKLGTNGVFLYPTFPCSAFKHNSSFYNLYATSYLKIFNSLGLPSTNVPCGFDKSGMPIGIQVVAAPHQDRLCLAVAEELEDCFGGWIPPS